MGKRKYIETPDKLWELFLAYKKYTKENPIKKMDFKGKDATKVHYLLERPLTMEGFENYVANQGLNHFLDDYFGNKNNAYSDYSAVCSRIRREIREDQISGGMAGIYNPSITQRLNNLVDRKDVKSDDQPLSNTKVVLPDGMSLEDYLKSKGLD